MKNFKKLSRQELKTVSGAGVIGGPIPWQCIYTHKWCENLKQCIPINASCDMKPFDPTKEVEL